MGKGNKLGKQEESTHLLVGVQGVLPSETAKSLFDDYSGLARCVYAKKTSQKYIGEENV